MPLNSYAEVQAFISETMTELGADAQFAPHEEFWKALSYEDFVNGNVPNIAPPIKILEIGSSSTSTLIHALRGEADFAPGNRYRRMPAGGPYFSEAQIQEIADWIDAECPEVVAAGST